MNQRLLREIIKQVLLTEAPIDVWKAKNRSLPSEQLSQAETYFTDLTGKYIASLHPTAKDLTKLDFEQLETLYKTVEMAKSKNLKAPFVQWLTKQLKQLPDLSLQQVIEDYIPPLLSLQKNKEKFEPNFLENLQSIEELNKSLNQKVSSDEMAVSEEQFGKLAEENGWILYMPHTTEASCEIGKTGGRRDTTWCTTRPDSSNMFLHYSASPDRNIILFSVVKKGVNAEKDTHAKMSVGFIDGKPKFNQGAGGVSVNAKNNNLTQKKFEEVLGKDLASRFLKIMQEKAVGLKGEHPAKDEFRKLVQNPRAFQAKLDSFAEDDNGRELRRNFVENALGYKETSPELFTTLARDKDEHVRHTVARNPNTPRELLTALSGDKDETVRYVVAKNPNTPPETLAALAGYGNTAIQIAVAQNPNTPTKTLAALAKSKDKNVVYAVAQNPNTPREVLTALSGNENYDVRINVAGNRKTPPKTLAALAGDTDEYVRYVVAKNPNTPREVLTALAKDEDKYVRAAVAENPNTRREVLTALAGDTDEYVRAAVAENPNTPREALIALAKYFDEDVRLKVAKNPNTPPEVLAALSVDADEYARTAVAGNPNTPREVLIALAKDKDKYVRNAAVKNLEALKAKPLVEAIIMEKVWRKLQRSI